MNPVDMGYGALALVGTVGLVWAVRRVVGRVAHDFVKEQLRKREDWLKTVGGGAWSLRYAIEEHTSAIADLVNETTMLRSQLQAQRKLIDAVSEASQSAMGDVVSAYGTLESRVEGNTVRTNDVQRQVYAINADLASKTPPTPRKRAR